MRTAPDCLKRRFECCLRYKQAARWQKPLLAPGRFLRNRLRWHGVLRGEAGELRTVSTFHLPVFTVVTGEAVSEQIASYGIYEENLTGAMLRLIEPGQVVVDIGMHLGYYTTLFALLVGEKGAVHAFEPTPSTRNTAQNNVSQFPQITVHPEAVWSSQTTLKFNDYGPRWMGFNSFTAARMEQELQPQPFQARTTTLDALRASIGRAIAFVKIDAESAEGEILAGAEKLLQTDRPVLSMEVGDFEAQPSSRGLIERLGSKGYAAWEHENGGFVRHKLKEVYSYSNLIFAPESQELSAV